MRKKRKKLQSRKIKGQTRVYVKCKKCKRQYPIILNDKHRLEWWKKYGKYFVCLVCDENADWANKWKEK